MSREQLLVAALRRGLDASGHAMTCAGVERFNAALRHGVVVSTDTLWKHFETDCNCWRKQAKEALDGQA